MPEQNRAFDEVRQILRRMDRSIDEARERRLSDGSEEPETKASAHQTEEPRRKIEPTETIGGPPEQRPAGQTAKRAGASEYGRAKPLRAPEKDASAWRRN